MIDPCPGCELRFHDQSVTADSITSFRRQVIYLPQRAVVLPATVEENLRLPFSSQVDSQAYSQQRAVQLLEQFAKPAEFLDKPAENLSGGERQIVSFVRAIQLDPDVLLLDEPTSALDRESAQRLEQVLGQWYETTGRNGIRRAFVLVSHQTEQLTRLTQQSVTIANGQLK